MALTSPQPPPLSRSALSGRQERGGEVPPLPSPEQSGGEWERGLGGEGKIAEIALGIRSKA